MNLAAAASFAWGHVAHVTNPQRPAWAPGRAVRDTRTRATSSYQRGADAARVSVRSRVRIRTERVGVARKSRGAPSARTHAHHRLFGLVALPRLLALDAVHPAAHRLRRRKKEKKVWFVRRQALFPSPQNARPPHELVSARGRRGQRESRAGCARRALGRARSRVAHRGREGVGCVCAWTAQVVRAHGARVHGDAPAAATILLLLWLPADSHAVLCYPALPLPGTAPTTAQR